MKFLVLLGLVSVAFAAPQPRKIFHENFEDFMDVIADRVGDELVHILSVYLEYEEFEKSLAYVNTDSFKNLVYEMEALPEFRDMQDFLESHSIDISYFITRFNDELENTDWEDDDFKAKSSRHEVSGRDLNSFIRDSVAIMPKDELAALFDQKVAEDEDFKAAIEGIQSDEWNDIVKALWQNELFLAEVKTLADNGIDIDVVLDQIVAIFGQN